jgi:hypothetical protein
VRAIKLLEQKSLSSDTVKELVLRGVKLVQETRDELDLPLFRTIKDTGKRLKNGIFRARKFRLRPVSRYAYAKAYGYFRVPSTIVLDEDLPLEGRLFNQPELATTATYYCAVHEVIHADDYTDNNRIVNETLQHIKIKHGNELAEASRILSRYSRSRWGKTHDEVVNTWAYQYVDSATHYRTYLVLKHKKFPKIDNIWVSLYNSIFSPRLFTMLENAKGLYYTAHILSKQIGETCILEIIKEYEEISQRNVRTYTV